MKLINRNFMSIEIILSVRQIQLDQNNLAVLNLKAVFAALPSAIVALYKVRTNSKDWVDVRPSFGILNSRGVEESMATMNIRYLGNIDSIKNIKLQVSWVWGQGIPEHKLSHSQFSQMYTNLKQKIGKEKTHMLAFTTKQDAKIGHDNLIINQKQTTRPEDDHSEEGYPQNQKEKKLKPSKQKSKSDSKLKAPKGKRIGWIWMVAGLVIAFLIGLMTGMKLQREFGVLQVSSGSSMEQKANVSQNMNQITNQDIRKDIQQNQGVQTSPDSPVPNDPKAISDSPQQSIL